MEGNKVKAAYINKLKNKYYGLLCEYEKEREWERFLDAIIIELMGFQEEDKTINYYILFYKTSSLRYLNYKHFRTTVFECMGLLSSE